MNISSITNTPFVSEISKPETAKSSVVDGFSNVLTKALAQVNDLQIRSDQMVQKMITDPDKVNIHEVTTLLSQAEMSLGFTKAVTDKVVNAYREITNLR